MSERTLVRGVFVLAMILAAASAAPASAQQPTASWTKMAPLPTARSEMKAATVSGKIYLIGGGVNEIKDGQEVQNYTAGFTTEYDPATNSWRERARAPEGLTHQALAVLNGKIYVAGGFAASQHTQSSAGFYSYEPATDRWQTLPPLSGKRGGGVLASVGGLIHSIGGRVVENQMVPAHEVYDPAKNAWRTAAPMQTVRDHAAVFVIDGKIHLIGGRTGESDANIGTYDIYDPETDKWTSAPPMPTPRSSTAFAEYRGLLFVAGGECRKDHTTYDEVEAFDLKSGRWLTFPALPSKRHAFAAATAGDKLFFFGGAPNCGGRDKIAEVLQLTLR